jgi:hypothetical protein
MMAVEHLKALKGITFSPWPVDDRTVSGATRKAVLNALVWEIPKSQDTTWKSVTSVAEETQYSRRQVQAAVRSLIEEGWIEPLTEVNGKTWKGKSNAYQVRLVRPQVTDGTSERETSGHIGVTPGHTRETSGHVPVTSGRPMGSMGSYENSIGANFENRRKRRTAAKAFLESSGLSADDLAKTIPPDPDIEAKKRREIDRVLAHQEARDAS